MDDKILEFRRQIAEELNCDSDRELLTHIDQQQAEIERLNRAYEVLDKALRGYLIVGHVGQRIYVKSAIVEAQRIKDGKDGEQG